MNKLIFSILLIFIFTSVYTNAEVKFVKYKKYLIPVNEPQCNKPKVIVSTDFGIVPTTSDANEPQDLTHYLAYSNHFDTRAIVASAEGTATNLASAISHYQFDYQTHFLTSAFGNEFPTPNYLNSILYTGVDEQVNPEPNNSNSSTIKIINEATNASPECLLNILVWGPMTDVAAAVHYMTEAQRNNLRIVAIGSSNRSGDVNAWRYIKKFKDTGGTLFSENIILMDRGNPTDAFRRLYLGNTCAVNPVLYNDNGVIGRTENIMDDLTDKVPTSDRGLRGLIQSTRGNFSSERLANWQNCQTNSRNSANSLRFADSLSTLYLLDSVLGFDGGLRRIIEANDSTATGMGNPAVLRRIYDNFRARMNDIY